ncbi:hypothetical protein PHYPSEUDO_002087 [Phytophthora pseudosyringae]|uniref:M96 mating-specific protein family n=1 Tax=Phytophthora pseudosyringae TaxID=221518 RepID=A0A8T1VUN7_9STRA|nr:hypothetical protein PHYPSEUDO_002087 [Phytophthora pseudosyringae]
MADDAAFLASLPGFLDEYGASVDLDGPDVARDVLLESAQLFAETEALLNDVATPEAVVASERHEPVKTAQAAKRRLKYRNKLKTERQTLEEEEKHLSEELGELQRARKRAKALGSNLLATSTWRAIAVRQKEGRLVAEEQHNRLKSAVESRAKVIQEIGQMMRERSRDVGLEKHDGGQLNADDTVLFEEFLHDLDAVYPRTDEIFQACGAEENPVTSYRLGPERKSDGVVEYIDNLDVLLIPFSFEETCATMWQSMIRLYRQRYWYRYDVADPENTIAVKSQVLSRESGGSVCMLVHFVMRRYLEAERMVVVWRALSEGEGEFTGIHSDETGWCVVRPNDADEPLMRTVMQTYVRFIPMDITNTSEGSVDGYQFTKLVVTSVEEDGAELARMMDSLLIEDSGSSES